jgi:hypothetical protein
MSENPKYVTLKINLIDPSTGREFYQYSCHRDVPVGELPLQKLLSIKARLRVMKVSWVEQLETFEGWQEAVSSYKELFRSHRKERQCCNINLLSHLEMSHYNTTNNLIRVEQGVHSWQKGNRSPEFEQRRQESRRKLTKWNCPNARQSLWRDADRYYQWWKQSQENGFQRQRGDRSMEAMLGVDYVTYKTVRAGLFKSFVNGWVPLEDPQWVIFRDESIPLCLG